MGVLSERLATAIERLEGVREDVHDMRAELRQVQLDVTDLKHTRTEGKTWINAVLSIGAVLFTALSWVLRISPLVLLFSCGVPPQLPQGQWYSRPVKYVVDPSMPEACLSASLEALEFWQGQGADYLELDFASPNWIGFDGLLPAGTISVTHEENLGPNVGGATRGERYASCLHCLRSAAIEIVDCSTEVAAHELGHALGLRHEDSIKNLMFPVSLKDNFGVNDSQRDWVK